MIGSARQYAKARHVSHTAVNKAIRTGKIPLVENGKIDFDVADAAWEKNRDITQPSRMSGEEMPAQSQRSSIPWVQPTSPERGSYRYAQLQHETAKAARVALEVQRMQGEVLDAGYVKDAVGGLISSARMRLLAIGNKIAPRLAIETDPSICETLIDGEIFEALEELSKWEPPQPKRQPRSAA